ncbi:MAG TPA: efflux RND transporter periplasmic adaptor subunit [Planctomycetota bacterium]|nr:efflux RND transporter periplasmic adaptor subunit [Planctomycetota bacterium]
MKIGIILASLALTGGVGWYLLQPKNGNGEKKPETKRVKVERGDIVVNVTATGEIKPLKEIELKSKASGLMVHFQKLPSEPVKEGELLAELDKKVEQRNLSLAEASLLTAEANLELTKHKYAADLKTTVSESAAMKEEEKQKLNELRRMEKLSGELITESELGTVRLAARLSEEKAKQADTALTLIRDRKDADEKLALAEVLKARVSVEDARERLADTELRAPVTGILLKKLVEEGQIVASGISATTGGTSIAIVADVSKLMVEANIDETDISKVKLGQPVEISLASGAKDRFKGRVDLILPRGEIDSNVIVFKARIGIEGDIFGRVLAGMTASVEIRVGEHKGVLLVPSEAVRVETNGTFVNIPNGEGTTAVAVKVGLDNGVKAEILEGLTEGAEVVVVKATEDGKNGGRPRLRF